jgi:hemerythrin-like metal-binding protein
MAAMEPFSLTPNLVTGITAIDEQHGELFDIANEVVVASQASLHPELFDVALSFLVGYTAYHFAAEETAMAQAGYPGGGAHASVHGQLREKVVDIVLRVRRQGPTQQSQADIVSLLEDWVVVHVRESDRAFARFVRERSIDVSRLTLPTIESLKSCGSLALDFDERFAGGVAALRSAQR